MIYQKPCNIRDRGVILIDILIAFSLSLVFIVVISESSAYSREVFIEARSKNAMLDAFESLIVSDIDRFTIRPYGNDRVEISSSSIPLTSIRVKPDTVAGDINQSALCSVDFLNDDVVGSYGWSEADHQYVTPHDITINVKDYGLPVDQSIVLTDMEVRGDTFYVSADPVSQSDADMYILKPNGGGGMDIISSINTGPGISSFVLVGEYIYAAALSTVAQLHVLGVDPLQTLSILGKYRVPLPHATDTPPLGSAIAYLDGKVLIGTDKWVGNELSIVDISNPISPVSMSGMEIGSKVNDIITHDNAAYVATAGQDQLEQLDIVDPSHPTVVTNFSPPGWTRQEGRTLSLFEDRLDFGRTAGGYNITTDHEMFTFTPPDPVISAYESADVRGGVYGLISDRHHEYLITRETGREFQIYDHDLHSSTSLTFSLPTAPQMMTCYLDKMYVLSHTSPTIYEITITER